LAHGKGYAGADLLRQELDFDNGGDESESRTEQKPGLGDRIGQLRTFLHNGEHCTRQLYQTADCLSIRLIVGILAVILLLLKQRAVRDKFLRKQ
jgi:hypothetical protein